MKEPRYISFVEFEQEGETKVWGVDAKRDGTPLGVVQWFARWRCYTFGPEPETVFSDECLRDITDFCEAKTKEHRIPRGLGE